MTEIPKISIVIPAFKAENFIKECLDSIESQSFFTQNNSYEILVGVDGCEETLDLLQKIRKQYRNLKVYKMLSNKGVYITRNTLFSLVKSENVIFFDADDIMKRNMVEKLALYMETNDIIRYYCQGFSGRIDNPSDILISRGSVFLKRKVFETLGGFKPWICSSDSDFLSRSAGLFREKRIIETLFYYRNHKASLTQDTLTGLHSAFRKKISREISQQFEYVNPVMNEYVEVI